MKMKPFQNLLKTWIAIGSMAAFMGGWIILGHSGKPVDTSVIAGTNTTDTTTSQLAPLPTLAPLGSVGNSAGSSINVQPLAQSPVTNFSQPRFRTRGS
jgi:hypothetical protein